jgi:RND family efflux transporter MFP subunit
MNKTAKIILSLSTVVLLASCQSKNGGNKEVAELKSKIESLKKEKESIDKKITDLETKLNSIDPNAQERTPLLVGVDTLRVDTFTHYIDLQGKVDAEGMAYVSPSGMGGQIKAIYVKLGDRVAKGQVILKLDDAIARQTLNGARQQLGQLKARLAQAQTIYERYQNLWKQNIGAEISVVNAKADVDALSAQLRAAEAQVAMAQEQVNMTSVKAELSGVIDELNVKTGELFSAQSAATPGMGIRIVNNTNLKVVTYVPENYVTRVNKGDKVEVVVPETGKPSFHSVLSVVGASINQVTRSFVTEAHLPSDPTLKPNQNAVMKIMDYSTPKAISVPVNLVQSDESGKYIFVAVQEGKKLIARRKTVIPGEVYGNKMEIKSGLAEGDVIITDGFQSAYNGQVLTTL